MVPLRIYNWPKGFDMNSDEDFNRAMAILDGFHQDSDPDAAGYYYDPDSFVSEWNRINEVSMSDIAIKQAIVGWHIWEDWSEEMKKKWVKALYK